MTVDLWYALRAGGTAYRQHGVRGRLSGAVRRARDLGVPWAAIVRATGLSETTLRRVLG